MTSGAVLAAAARPLPLRKRLDLTVRAQRFGGRRYLAVKDPLTLRYYHLREEEFFVFQQLDGRTSADQILASFESAFPPRRLKMASLQGFLSMLHREGLVVSDVAGQDRPLLDRRRKRARGRTAGAAANPLAIRFRGIDPEPLLARLYPVLSWLFRPWSVAAMVLLVLAAIGWIALHAERLQQRLPDFQSFFGPGTLVWFAVALAASKFLHEAAHALACKHFGGECHELGVMFLVFTPCLFVNVSDSWMLPNKWQRIAIAAAGVWAELVLAAICTFVWWFSEPGLLNSLSLRLMFLSSVGAVLFNANPLLPYDGYYVLADLLEVPNLRQRASGLLRQLLARWLLGCELGAERIYPDRRRGLLLGYAIASLVYRVLLVAALLWFCYAVLKPYGLQVLAQLLSVVVVAGMAALPLWRLSQYIDRLLRRGELKPHRLLGASLIVAAGLAAMLAVPLPYRVQAPAVIEPLGARRVFVTSPGILQWSLGPGIAVRQGDVLAKLENPELDAEIERLRGRCELLEIQRENLRLRSAQHTDLRSADAGSQIPAIEAALADARQRLERRLVERQHLILRAPREGVVMPPRSRREPPPPGQLPEWDGHPLEPQNQGAYLPEGTLFCMIGDPSQVVATLLLDESHVSQVRVGQAVRLQIDQLPGRYPRGQISEIATADLNAVPPELLAAGRMPIRDDGQGGDRVAGTWYQARVRLEPLPRPPLAGAVGRARVLAAPQPLGRRLGHYLLRTLRFAPASAGSAIGLEDRSAATTPGRRNGSRFGRLASGRV